MRDIPLYYDRDGNPMDTDAWARRCIDMDYKRVAETQVGPYWISTVWLGIDHSFGSGPPVIFETMVFATSEDMESLGPDLDMERYCTEEQARVGHEAMVLLVRATTRLWEDQDTTREQSE